MFRSCSEGLVIVDWIRLILTKQGLFHYCIYLLPVPKIRSGVDAIGSSQPIPGRSDEPITARTNLYKCLCLQEFNTSHLPDRVQDQVARLATPSQGVRQIAGPLTEGPGPTSRPGGLPAPRVACRCSPVGFDRQHGNTNHTGRRPLRS
ncbi:hypothetical protein GQ55_6G218200 [Panicum hallii var. hallii]|uniref:Uncharacterized protein n=1 Tax=Panicum hallii var. hallii TaxID=1504633 RepID=A0A2T7D8C7_9POAL|nr:hypothetical protein GQ55_6G218200 [Panicum hallii var. hallii]